MFQRVHPFQGIPQTKNKVEGMSSKTRAISRHPPVPDILCSSNVAIEVEIRRRSSRCHRLFWGTVRPMRAKSELIH